MRLSYGTVRETPRKVIHAVRVHEIILELHEADDLAARMREPVNDPVIAAIDQNVGNGFTQFQALRDRQKVVLALGGRVFDQIIISQLLRAREHRPGDLNDIVEGKRT